MLKVGCWLDGWIPGACLPGVQTMDAQPHVIDAAPDLQATPRQEHEQRQATEEQRQEIHPGEFAGARWWHVVLRWQLASCP